MRAILIDPEARALIEVQASSLHDYYALLGCDMIEVATYLGKPYEDADCIYVDEEGLMKPIKCAFYVQGARKPPFAGKGLVVGTNSKTGDNTDAKIAIPDLWNIIIFPA